MLSTVTGSGLKPPHPKEKRARYSGTAPAGYGAHECAAKKRSAYFFAGEVAGEAPPLAAAGDAFVLLAGAGVPAGLAASADAGRMPPRLAGFESMFAEN